MVAHDDPRLAKVGFAKLVGSGIELYTKKHEITMGRLSKSGHVDVVLGEYRCMYPSYCCLTGHASDTLKSRISFRVAPCCSQCLFHACRRKHEHIKAARQDCIQQRHR